MLILFYEFENFYFVLRNMHSIKTMPYCCHNSKWRENVNVFCRCAWMATHLSFSFIFSFFFLRLYPQHTEVPRPRVESELPLLAYATAMAKPDPSHICDLCHSHGNTGSLTHWVRSGIEPSSSWRQRWVLNTLSHNENSGTCPLNRSCFLFPLAALVQCVFDQGSGKWSKK